jgi:hypothetical protein
MANEPGVEVQWLAVIGKALAFQCLSQAEMRDKDLLSQSLFLEAFGISRVDAAKMLGTTTNSLGNLARRAARRKGRGNAPKKR